MNRKKLFTVLLIWVASVLWPIGSVTASEITGRLSTEQLRAGEAMTVQGRIPPGEDLFVVIAAEKGFQSSDSMGTQEKKKLADKFGETEIPPTCYIVTNRPDALAHPQMISRGKWFPPFRYDVKINKIKPWTKIPPKIRSMLTPIRTEAQWKMLIFAHEDKFGMNTISKEKPIGGGSTRMVLSDFSESPEKWNRDVHLRLDKSTGDYSVTLIPNRNLAPGTDLAVTVNGQIAGDFKITGSGYYFKAAGTYMNPLVVFLGALLIGIMFVIMGAAGGLFTAAFQIIVLGTQGMIGINAANMVKPTNLFLTIFSPITGVWGYFKERRLAWPVALCFVSGILIGSFWIGPTYSARYLPMKAYKFYLGFFCLILAVKLWLESTSKGINKKKGIKAIVAKYNEAVKQARAEGRTAEMGAVRIDRFQPMGIDFTFWGEKFRANPITLFFGGIVIGCIASAFGVGGGFMLVPFMTSVMGFPMYLAVPISLCGTFATSIGGVARYALMGYPPDWTMAALIAAGAIIGGKIGPKIQKKLPEVFLKRGLAVLLLLVFLKFTNVLPFLR
ncbi:MAG: sulfite exporter TauE/SafE family protein [Deltaproteobacteria bacterium]|nr:sulfite exporter TauE/SafE family protein [Deltaproteobacteria bacterium]